MIYQYNAFKKKQKKKSIKTELEINAVKLEKSISH